MTLEKTSLQKMQETFDEAVLELLMATERLHGGVVEGAEADALDAAFDRRTEAFQALQSLAERGMSPSTAARVCLARVRSLDEEMLVAGADQVGEIRDARHALNRRRSAVQAHASRERGEPRLVTVKA